MIDRIAVEISTPLAGMVVFTKNVPREEENLGFYVRTRVFHQLSTEPSHVPVYTMD